MTVERKIDLGDGSGVQVFTAETADELLDKLAEAQANATRKIRQQEQENKSLRRQVIMEPERGSEDPDGPMPQYRNRALTPDEKFALGQRLLNPATAVDALNEAMEAGLGGNLAQVRRSLQRSEETPREMRGRDAAEQFLLNHPEFITSAANQQAMFEYMDKHNLNVLFTRNFEKAFAALSAAGLLQLRAVSSREEAPANGNAPGNGAPGDSGANGNGTRTERPRFTSTSISTRGSGTPRGGTGPKMPTAEEIDRMSPAQHRAFISDPVHGARNRAHEERIENERAARAQRR